MAENKNMTTLINQRSFPRGKSDGREVNSSPSSAKANNVWSYTSIPPARLRGVGRNKLTLYIYIYLFIYLYFK